MESKKVLTTPILSSNDVYLDIRRRIVSMELEPGEFISENRMCGEYGVSRSVIRTIFSRLQEMQLLDIYPQRGTYISHIDLNYISDLLMLRTAAEKEVLYEIFTKLDKESRAELVRKLEENIAKQKKCYDENNRTGEFSDFDAEFHNIMLDSVHRRALFEIMHVAMLHIERWRHFNVTFDNRIQELIEEHTRIFNAIKNDNLKEAQHFMRLHFETISSIAQRVTQMYPGYFK